MLLESTCPHFNSQHWLLRHIDFYLFKSEFKSEFEFEFFIIDTAVAILV